MIQILTIIFSVLVVVFLLSTLRPLQARKCITSEIFWATLGLVLCVIIFLYLLTLKVKEEEGLLERKKYNIGVGTNINEIFTIHKAANEKQESWIIVRNDGYETNAMTLDQAETTLQDCKNNDGWKKVRWYKSIITPEQQD